MTLSTPSGTPASSASSPRRSADSGVCSAGFSTTVQPQVSAGPSFHAAISSGKFHEAVRRRGCAREALRRYPGPLLPGSEVPLVVELRQRLDEQVRQAALDSGDADTLGAWLQNPSGRDDVEACRRLAHALDPADPRRVAALSRLRRLCET